MVRVSLQPAYLLHSRPFRDSSQLLEVLTAEYGRLGLVAKGMRRRARGGSLSATLQPFRPLLMSFSGRGELMSLLAAEVAAPAPPLAGKQLFSGLYLNELLLRLLHRNDACPALFADYGQTLQGLGEGQAPEPVLRRFELRMLDELGYGFDPGYAAGGGEIRDQAWYTYAHGSGLMELREHQVRDAESYPGGDLRAIARGDFSGSAARTAKRLLRQVLAEHLGSEPLHTRELFVQHHRMGESAG